MAIPTVLAVKYLDNMVHARGLWWYVADGFSQPSLGLVAKPPMGKYSLPGLITFYKALKEHGYCRVKGRGRRGGGGVCGPSRFACNICS